MKKIRNSFFIFMLFFLFAIPIMAEHQYIYDDADIFNDEEISELEQLAVEYSEENKTDLLVVTTKDPGDRDVKEYTQDFYDENAPGYNQAHGDTAILTIDLNESEVYVAGFGNKQDYLSNERLDQIREHITPLLSDGDYKEASKQFFEKVDQYLDVNPIINPESIFLKTWFQLVVAIVVGAVVVGSMIFNMGGRVTVDHQTYMDPQNSRVVKKRDTYIRKSVQKTKIQKNNNRSSGGGGGVTSGGHSHTGSRGGF
ncbi:TPM domain-containing protein [Gracilibacillus lacisalsi]|uniref:TPM domain-containing protein n=1 Tax=Gracilibacillus lacisalsi TaxID=393087 RepID=UPI0003680224|nr:TPM domain-containing protein [Gracilibacillus lacisalsi]